MAVSDSPSAADKVLPAIGVGTWAWGNRFLWGYDAEHDDPILEACFRLAVERGFRFFDTADSYGTGRWEGRSESLLGRFCAALPSELRDPLTLATKLAPFPWRLGRRGFDRAFAASSQRLQGRLDRVQLHWSTARYAPWQEGPLLEGLGDLLERGDVRELGVSNFGPERLRSVYRRLQERGLRLSSLQVQLSLLAPLAIAPGGVAQVCRELGVELIAYSPLALGLLSEAGRSGAPLPSGPRRALFQRLRPRLQPLIAAMDPIAQRHRAPLAAVALNWCRSHGAMPIPGLRRLDQVEIAADALLWELEPKETESLDRLALALGPAMPANPFQSS